jgi:hypothetical protein
MTVAHGFTSSHQQLLVAFGGALRHAILNTPRLRRY